MPAAAEPAPAALPAEWEVRTDNNQDRWILRLPANTLNARCQQQYRDTYGQLPDYWIPYQPPDYVKVTATQASKKRKKRSVLKTELIPGGGERFATIATAAFGRNVAIISIAPSGEWRFKLARLNTTASRLNIAAVILGAASAVITAIFTIVIGAPPPGQGLSAGVLAWGAIAAACAFFAPWLALASSMWFRD